MKIYNLISNFFNLNYRYETGNKIVDMKNESVENIEIFSLGAREVPRLSDTKGVKKNVKKMKFREQLLLYVFTALGVCLSSIIKNYHNTAQISFNISIYSIILSFFISLMLMPVVYEKLALAPNTPLIVRLGLFFQTGVFWHTMIDFCGNTI